MKTYVCYFVRSHLDGSKFVTATGDRGVVQLDSRNKLSTQMADAVRFNGFRRPVYAAYQIERGDSLLSAKPVTEIIPL